MGAPPPFLAGFDVATLQESDATIVVLDSGGVIVWINAAWERFAVDNDAPEVAARFGIGASYYDGINGLLADYFRATFANALLTNEPFLLRYECSSPTRYREHHLRALPVAGHLLLEHSVVVDRAHDRLREDGAFVSDSGITVQCANCRRTRDRAGAWLWVVAHVERSPDRTSHGICPTCMGYYFGALPE